MSLVCHPRKTEMERRLHILNRRLALPLALAPASSYPLLPNVAGAMLIVRFTQRFSTRVTQSQF